MLVHTNSDNHIHTSSTALTGKLSPGSQRNFTSNNNQLQNNDFKKFIQQRVEAAKNPSPEQQFSQQKSIQPKTEYQENRKLKVTSSKQLISLPNLNIKKSFIAPINKEFIKTVQRNSRIISSVMEQDLKLETQSLIPFDMLWNSTYLTKYNINEFIDENKTLRAKVWNYEKENRKMHKQLDQWGLSDQINNEGKPFVDSSTLQKVFSDNLYLTVTKKQQMINLQSILKEKDSELQTIQEQIDKYKQDGELIEDFEKDSTKEFYVVLHKAQTYQYKDRQQLEEEESKKILSLEAYKTDFKVKMVELADINNVYQFEVEVQQNMCSKLVKETLRMEKKFRTLDEYVDGLEEHIKQKQPQTLNKIQQSSKHRQKNKNQGIGKIEKTSEEILRDKVSLIDEQKNKIEQLNFQIQEMTRTCIMEKQDLLKDIKDTKEKLMGFTDKILNYRLNILKFDQFEQTFTSDKSNQKGDSILTQQSQ